MLHIIIKMLVFIFKPIPKVFNFIVKLLRVILHFALGIVVVVACAIYDVRILFSNKPDSIDWSVFKEIEPRSSKRCGYCECISIIKYLFNHSIAI